MQEEHRLFELSRNFQELNHLVLKNGDLHQLPLILIEALDFDFGGGCLILVAFRMVKAQSRRAALLLALQLLRDDFKLIWLVLKELAVELGHLVYEVLQNFNFLVCDLLEFVEDDVYKCDGDELSDECLSDLGSELFAVIFGGRAMRWRPLEHLIKLAQIVDMSALPPVLCLLREIVVHRPVEIEVNVLGDSGDQDLAQIRRLEALALQVWSISPFSILDVLKNIEDYVEFVLEPPQELKHGPELFFHSEHVLYVDRLECLLIFAVSFGLLDLRILAIACPRSL